MSETITFINPPEFAPPKGYSNGALCTGKTLYVAGQVGWNAQCVFETEDLAEQFGVALDNVLAVVREAGGKPEDLAKMTVYVTDLDAYRNSLKAIGKIWRARLGRHFPAMALVGVAGLVEHGAKIEIEAIAHLPSS